MNETQTKRYPHEFVKQVVKGEITANHFLLEPISQQYTCTLPRWGISLTIEEYDELFPLPGGIKIDKKYNSDARCVRQKKRIEMFEECYKSGTEPTSWIKLLFGVDVDLDSPILQEYLLWKKIHEEELKEKQTVIPKSFIYAILGGTILRTHFGDEDRVTRRRYLFNIEHIKIYKNVALTEEELNILFPPSTLNNQFIKINECSESERVGFAIGKAASMLVGISIFAGVDVERILYPLVRFNHGMPNVKLLESELIEDTKTWYKQYLEKVYANFNVVDA